MGSISKIMLVAGASLALAYAAKRMPEMRFSGPVRTQRGKGSLALKDLPPLAPETVARLRRMDLPGSAEMRATLDAVEHSLADNDWAYSGAVWASEGARVEEMWPHLCPHPVVLEKELIRDMTDAYAAGYKDYVAQFGKAGAMEGFGKDSLRMRYALYRFITADAATASTIGRALSVSAKVRQLRARHQDMQADYIQQKPQVDRYLSAVERHFRPDIPDPADLPVWSDYIDSKRA